MKDNVSVVVCNGALTPEIIESAVRQSLDNFGKPDVLRIDVNAFREFQKYEKLEKEWRKHPPHIYKQLKLKYNLKNKWSVKRDTQILPLLE